LLLMLLIVIIVVLIAVAIDHGSTGSYGRLLN
jgi:hypothetical protein